MLGELEVASTNNNHEKFAILEIESRMVGTDLNKITVGCDFDK